MYLSDDTYYKKPWRLPSISATAKKIPDQTSRPLPSIPTVKTKRKEVEQNDIKNGGYVLFVVKIVMMVLAVLLISTSRNISTVKPCQLEKALNLINLDYTPHPCKYNAIQKKSSSLFMWGIGVLCWNAILFVALVYISHYQRNWKKYSLMIIYLLVLFGAIVNFACLLYQYSDAIKVREDDQDIDFIRLQTQMVSLFEQHFKTENITSSDQPSRNWNHYFIQYDCCAVREVQGTSNDFDNTPWCTTEGSCQATASQIPKSCCKDVTQDDYQSAPSICHASVNLGTFKPSCISRMRALSTINISEKQLASLFFCVLILLAFQILESFLAILLIVTYC